MANGSNRPADAPEKQGFDEALTEAIDEYSKIREALLARGVNSQHVDAAAAAVLNRLS